MTISAKKLPYILIGGSIGNITEWFNFLLYGYLSPVIAHLFFPTKNKLISLTLTFTVFALSFFARSIGAILFGWIGDKYGRQRALVISLLMMAIPTFLIGCLPTYESIGIASAILLCVLRICQGLSAGGEHTGSAVYILENAPPARKTLCVSLVPATAALGIFISSIAALIIINSFSTAQLLAGGWRTGYWVGTLLCIISLFLRLRMPETPDFKKLQTTHLNRQYTISALFKNSDTLKKLILVFSLASSWGIIYQILFIWMPTYLSEIRHFNHTTALQINILFILILASLIILVGYCADYIKRKHLLYIFSITMLVTAYPLFLMLSYGDVWQIYLAMGIFTFVFSLYLPTSFITMAELFPPQMRYTGFSFGFNVGLAIFGGTCPLVVTYLIKITNNPAAPAWYLTLAAFSVLITCLLLSKNLPTSQKINLITN